MNNLTNEIIQNQYKRFLAGSVVVIRGIEFLVSKGFTTVTLESYKEYMKSYDVEI